MAYYNPYQQRPHPQPGMQLNPQPQPYAQPQQQQGFGTKGGPQQQMTYDPASGTYQYQLGGTTPTMDQALDVAKNMPLPSDLTSFYQQMQQLYGGAMGTAQQSYQQMQDYLNQLNAMLGQDVGAQQHQQLMDMNRPVGHPNSMQYLYGY